MKISLMKKGLVISLVLLVFSGCEFDLQSLLGQDTKTKRPEPTTPTVTETPPAFDTTKPMTEVAPYYANGDIEYYPTFIPLTTDSVIWDKKDQIIDSYTAGWDPKYKITWPEISQYFHFFEVGTIKAQNYKNQALVVLKLDCDGMCMGPSIYRFAYDKTKYELTFLTRHSHEDKVSMVIPLTYTEDKTVFFKGIEPPEEIKVPNTNQVLELETRYDDYLPANIVNQNFIFADKEIGNLYQQSDYGDIGCLHLKAPDGSTSSYVYNPHFFKSEPVQITWKDGSPQTTNLSDVYGHVTGGCGLNGDCYIVQQMGNDEVELAGTTSTGINLYTPKNPGAITLPSPTAESINPQEKLSQAYEDYKSSYEYNEEAKKTPLMDFQTFVSSKPLLYWQDPLNRWAALIRLDIKPPAECGKPVIYLYPEQETDVNVKVNIDKLTKTIPAYRKTGWTVKASPDGTLYNYADNQTYPYLFWEGQKDGGVSITKGFLVKRNDLAKFLNTSLTKLGLTKQEKQDFTDFWLTRMLDNKEPYFFISFVGTRDFNKVAPLEITPVPTTLIRVFMYYMPTYDKIRMPEQELTSVQRNGFTVVEWGGTSSKPWRD